MVKDDADVPTSTADSDQQSATLVEVLKQRIGAKRFDAWFHSGVRFDLSQPKMLTLLVSTSLERECLQKHFKGELRDACQAAGFGKRRLEFVVECDNSDQKAESPKRDDTPTDKSAGQRAAHPDVLPLDSRQDGLAAAIVSSSNRQAVGLGKMIASGNPVASPALFWGPSGSGKTHLLKAIRSDLRRYRRQLRVEYVTAEEFTSGFVQAVHGRTISDFRGRHRTVDVLLIDDTQFLLGKQKTLEELQYTLDALSTTGAAVILASDRSPAEMRKVSGELLSRLGAGVSVELSSPDFAAKQQLVERFAAQRGLPLEPDAARLIAGGLIGGAWEAQGVVNKLHLTWQLLGQAVSDGMIHRVLEDINRVSTPNVRIKDIQDAVCQVFGIEANVIKSNKRTKSATEPRMLAMWLARKYTGSAWSEIGDHFGRRSHSTVISACRRVEDLLGRHASVRVPGGACQMQEALRLVEVRLRTA